MNYIGIILVVPDNDQGNYIYELRSNHNFELIPIGKYAIENIQKVTQKKDGVCPCMIASSTQKQRLCIEAAKKSLCFITIHVVTNLSTQIISEEGDAYTYIIEGRDVKEALTLVADFWTFRATGGMLSKRLISSYIHHKLLVWEGETDRIGPSSYDLSLGDDYYYGGKIYTLSEKQPFLQIDPYDYAIASSAEIVNMPKDISGRFDVSVSLFCQGIILSNGTQIDPGFCGKLFCLLFNTSNKPIYLKRGAHFVTMEFCKLLEETVPYSGKYNYKTSILPYIPASALHGAINELKQDLDTVKEENRQLQSIFLGILTLIIALIALLVTVR